MDGHDLEGVRRLFDKSDLGCDGYGVRSSVLHFAATWGSLKIV
jgi:hypothetical protein